MTGRTSRGLRFVRAVSFERKDQGVPDPRLTVTVMAERFCASFSILCKSSQSMYLSFTGWRGGDIFHEHRRRTHDEQRF